MAALASTGPSSTVGVKRKAKASSSSNGAVKKSKRAPLGKLLASNDVETREQAVEELLEFLSGKDAEHGSDVEQDGNEQSQEPEWDAVKLPKAFREEHMLVLWQGCFYCMYNCDKPLPQQKLANQLAQPLLDILENPKLKSKTARIRAALSYLSVFWLTIVREWPGIDKHRVDKYFSLIRRMLCNTFVMLRQIGWHEKAMAEVSNILTRLGGPIHLQDSKTPVSVAYHVIDIYVEELERSLDDQSEEDPPAPVLDLLQPWIDALSSAASKAAFQRVLDNVFEPILADLQSEDAGKRQKSDLTPVTLEHTLAGQPKKLDQAILKRMFDAGAAEATDPVARKRLYAYASRRGFAGDD